MTEALHQPLIVAPEYRDYVWGGQRLRPGQLTAEAWIVYEGDRVTSGPLKDRTLADIAAEYGSALLGTRPIKRTGTRFPVLIKLLDCAEWLSLQVHPNDEQASNWPALITLARPKRGTSSTPHRRLKFWADLRAGTTKEMLEEAVRGGTLLDRMERLNVHAGDTVFIRAGTIHALGPGVLLYEIQQTSDLTYRVFDWNRPASEGRQLHIEESLAVADPNATAPITPRPAFVDGQATTLIKCDYFTLDLLTAQTKSIDLATRGESFHALTVIEGEAVIENDHVASPAETPRNRHHPRRVRCLSRQAANPDAIAEGHCRMKVTVIGGGSTYTPELINGFLARLASFPLRELWLMDIDQHRLDIVGKFAQRMVEAKGAPFKVILTTDRRAAIRGASYVITQLRVGMMEARRKDEYLGQRHGLIGQETTGVGGMAKALRTIPVILDIANDMRELAPGALLANFTNPSGLITEALFRYAPDVPAVGVCNVALHAKMDLTKVLEQQLNIPIDPARTQLKTLGLNHLTWHSGFTLDGEEMWPRIMQHHLAELRSEPGTRMGHPHDRVVADAAQLLSAILLLHGSQTGRATAVAALARGSRAWRSKTICCASTPNPIDPSRPPI